MSSDTQDMSTDSDETVGVGDSQPPENAAAATEIQDMTVDIDETVGDSQPPENAAAATEIQDMTVDGDETVGGGDSQPPEKNAAAPEIPEFRLNLTPDIEHLSDTYDDPQLEFSSLVLSSLEKYLPANLLTLNRDEKVKLLSKILRKYISRDELSRKKRLRNYRAKIISNYEPRWRGLYDIHPTFYFLRDFREAIREHTEEGYRRIMSEPFPGVFVFQMFRPDVLERLIQEVDHFKDWAKESKFQIMPPNNINSHGIVLADIGMDTMLQQLVEGFIFPICRVLFNDVCIGKFNSHHGFVVEYGMDAGFDIHMDDSEVTVNVCLGEQFEGGETYFRGVRCVKHVNTETLPEEMFECPHIAGQVMLHRGRHRNGSRATTMGYRANMILWCRSSFYREQQNYDKGYFDWCGQCVKEDKDNESTFVKCYTRILDAKRKEMISLESSKPKVDETQHNT
ncbi:2-oxoglutarate and iron-dependent oxygenase domain-containing protein CP2 [Cardamine amara subsp. amara]|uniref:2-oxoglutarate and iron-dependent oxygenase domain-containing protein CP2 n=1 Tax=Cardamine amara subsp. amara TaxID=228776 RepID=A0ABD1B533_CARAN